MNFDELRTADFKVLDDAVEDWSTMVRDLEKLHDSAKNGLKKSAEDADWSGYNAAVSKAFILKTAHEFSDAHIEATSIRNILRDICSELKDYQKKLMEALVRGHDKHLEVTATDSGGFIVRSTHREHAGKEAAGSKHSSSELETLRDDIERILNAATESDSSADKVLRAVVDRSRLGFSDAKYRDRETAAKAVEEADALARLANKNPSELTAAEFDRLNAGLKKYGKDPLFSERFATDLGPRKTLAFWADISSTQPGSDVSRQRMEKLDDLQRNLGLTLASASQSDSGAMTDWKTKMIDLGDKQIGANSAGPMGFQVMSNLMRTGDYDDQFLNDYGDELMATERKLTNDGEHANLAWRHMGADPRLNRIGEDSGSDPLTGYLKGLSNSPAAATDFFNQEFVSKDDSPFERDTDDNDKKGKVALSNFQYLFEERDWPKELDSHGDELNTGRNNLALALEAATTGHPAGEMPTADTPAHSPEQAKLFKSIVLSVADDPDRLGKHGFMSDSMGQISAEYMPDIHRSLHAGNENESKLFPIAGASAELSQNDMTRFLYTVGRNPEGFAAVNLGQHSYTTQLMQYHFEHPELYVGDKNFSQAENLKAAIGGIARTAGEVEGTIGAGRAYEGELEGGKKDADYNAVIEKMSTWGGSAVGIGIGLATAPFTGPGGAVAGGLAGTAAGEIIGAVTEGTMKDSSGDIIYRNGQDLDKSEESTYTLVEQSARKAGEKAGDPSPLIVAFAASEAEAGFGNARDNVGKFLEGEGVPRELEREG